MAPVPGRDGTNPNAPSAQTTTDLPTTTAPNTPSDPALPRNGAGTTAAPVDHTGRTVLIGVLAALAIAALAAVAYVVTVLAVRRRRRTRRRHRTDTRLVIGGAWEATVERLEEAGLRPDRAATPFELAWTVQRRTPARIGSPLHELARVYSEASYSPDRPSVEAADDAWRQADAIDDALTELERPSERWRRTLRTPSRTS